MRIVAVGLLVLAAASMPSGAQSNDAPVRAVVQRYMDARARVDARALDALFTRDADQHTTAGEWRRGAASVVPGSLESSQRNAGTRTIIVETVRFVTPDVAIADGPYIIDPGNGASVRRMWTTIVLKREPDGWRISAIRNMTPATP
jgi:uncharacterized protein (TIGR02246 family)